MIAIKEALIFLIKTLFDLYLILVFLRFLFQYLRIDASNPLLQLCIRTTNFFIFPLRRFIPGFWGIDSASLFLLIALKMLELSLVALIANAGMNWSFSLTGLLIWSVGDILNLAVNVIFYSIIGLILFSWFGSNGYNPFVVVFHRIAEPLLGRARQWIPPVSGFDLSPILVILGLQLLTILMINPIVYMGQDLMRVR